MISRVTEADVPELALMRGYCDFYEVDPSDEALLALARTLIEDPGQGLQLIRPRRLRRRDRLRHDLLDLVHAEACSSRAGTTIRGTSSGPRTAGPASRPTWPRASPGATSATRESWVHCLGALDELGFPVHDEGASIPVPGLHFVGVHFLRKRQSSLLIGVGEDAAIVASRIASSLG